MEKKYIFSDKVKVVNDRTLHQIQAVRSFGEVKAGDIGGFIESESNLSHDGDCWVGFESIIGRQTYVKGNVLIGRYTSVGDQVEIDDNVRIGDDSVIGRCVRIGADVCIGNNAVIDEIAHIGRSTTVGDNVSIGENVRVGENVCIGGRVKIYPCARIGDKVSIDNRVSIGIWAIVGGGSIIHSWNYTGHIADNAAIADNAIIESGRDYIIFYKWWGRGRYYFTWTKSNNTWREGAFHGTGEELIAKAYEESEQSGREYERAVKYVQSILEDEK